VSVPPPARAFPSVLALDPEGRARPLAALWAEGPALLVWGHSDCGTTRLVLPFLDRLHALRPKGACVAVLQDTEEAARELRAELGLSLPVWRDPEPYEASAAVVLAAVPTVMLVGRDGLVERRSEGFRRTEMEALAERLGLAPPFFAADDPAPSLRPG
jgi:hypothetical protein